MCTEEQMNLNIFCCVLFPVFIAIPYKFYALSAVTVTLKIFVKLFGEGSIVSTAQIVYPKNFNWNTCDSFILLFTSNTIRIYLQIV